LDLVKYEKMDTITVNIPKELRTTLERHPEVNWNEVSKEAIFRQLKRLALADFLEDALDKSEFNEQDALEFGKKIKQGRLKQLKEQGLV